MEGRETTRTRVVGDFRNNSRSETLPVGDVEESEDMFNVTADKERMRSETKFGGSSAKGSNWATLVLHENSSVSTCVKLARPDKELKGFRRRTSVVEFGSRATS